MKRILATALSALMVVGLFAACGNGDGGSSGAIKDDASVKVLNLWAFTDEVPNMLEKYKEVYKQKNGADFPYEIKTTIIATTDGAYQPALDQALSGGGADAPDIYVAEGAFVLKYVSGDMSQYAIPYADLGITDQVVKDAQIAQYTIDIGKNKDGKLAALGYQSAGGVLIYRRSIAKEVWGTDDPETIKTKVGPGWTQFFKAAEELKAKGYSAVSGIGDIWHPIQNDATLSHGWIVDGKLDIPAEFLTYMDYCKTMKDNGWMNDTVDWSDAWYADMSDAGLNPVFGWFGPAWLINYVMAGNSGGTAIGEGAYGDYAVCEAPVGYFWGGSWIVANKDSKLKKTVADIINWITVDSSETGLQYYWATGTLKGPGGTKDAVANGVVMGKADGKLDFLGGQNMFDAFIPAGKNASGKNMGQYDETLNGLFNNEVREYIAGNITKDEAISAFKANVKSQLDIDAA